METAQPLPGYLVKRYRKWKATHYTENESWYRMLADSGQRPRAMVISCCDSRVHVTSIFGADQGEFFIHRNIANLVPPYHSDGRQLGTSAALEYAVCVLKVAHIIVMGHSGCGGVRGCIDMCKGDAPDLEEPTSYVGRWMDILRPGFDRVRHIGNDADQRRALEKESVVISLENLMSFPFVAEAVASSKLTLHGLWHDIGEGEVAAYNLASSQFETV